MRCPIPQRVEARMADGDDSAGPFNTQLPVVIDGESGNDSYNAGNPSFTTNVRFRGGAGFDTASYAGSGGAAGGRGVRITNDGVADDGRPGLDTDNIGRDVEELIGSRLADDITATDGLELRGVTVIGGQGDDVVRAGSRAGRVFFNMGPAPDGADKIIGGPTRSIVEYRARTRPITATLNHDGADDGEAGEGDELVGGHEAVFGGAAGDIIRAPFGSRAAHELFGEGGNDQLDGADGPDRIVGGAGGDAIRAFGGDDRIFAADGTADTVDCGFQTDTIDFDSIDNLGSCENGTVVGVLRLAPRRLGVRAGDIARLRLSWTHPQSWRKLRTITLRLRVRDRVVGRVVVRPHSRRLADSGAVKVVRTRSRLARKRTTVTARLALRLHDSLAGRTVTVDVEAADRRGRRQLERKAATVRVTE
jgi:hypothetical protein